MKPWLIETNDFSGDLFAGSSFGSFLTPAILRGKFGDPALLGTGLVIARAL